MKLKLPLLDWQRDFIESPAQVKALSGASDTGKSWVCRLAILDHCLRYPQSEHLVVSSTYQQAHRAIIEPMLRDLQSWGLSDYCHYLKNEMYLQFWNGARVEVYGADKFYDKIKSREVFSIFIEEATTIDDKYIEGFFAEVNRRLRQPGFENINKPLYMATNPDVKSRWLYENLFENPPDYAHVRQMCFPEGFNRNDEEREKKILMGSKRQRQLYYWGEWGAMEGQAFFLDEDVHIKDFDLTDLDKFYITFDYGFHPDPMVYLLASEKNGVIFIIDEVVLDSTPVNRHKPYIEPWFKHNIVGFTGDTAPGSGEIRDLLLSLNISYYPTVKARSLGWTTLADLIDLKQFVIHPRCKKTIRSLGSMIWQGSTIGVDCEGDYDDEADAVRYFFMSPIIFYNLGLRQSQK